VNRATRRHAGQAIRRTLKRCGRRDDKHMVQEDLREGDDAKHKRRVNASRRAWLILVCVVLLGVTVDLWTKHWAFANVAGQPVKLDLINRHAHPYGNPIPIHAPKRILPGDLLALRLVVNRGAVFGVARDQRAFFIAFTILAIIVTMYYFVRRTGEHETLAQLGFALICTGGLGNLYDRVRFGVVRDFLQVLPDADLPNGWAWPGGNPDLLPWVFNFADVFLLLGATLLFMHFIRHPRVLTTR